MKTNHRIGSFRPFRSLIRRSVRYLLVSRGFIILEAAGVLGSLSIVLTGSRIIAIDRLGNRADIVASIVVTGLTILVLRAVNKQAMIIIDRRFFREAYNAQLVLTELSKSVHSFSRIEQLIEVAATTIRDALHPVNVTVFLEDDATGDFVSTFSLGNPAGAANRDDPSTTLSLPREGWVVRRLRRSASNAIDIQKVDELTDNAATAAVRTIHQEEYSVLRRVRSRLLVPIESNGHLYGIISLGRRMGDLAYSNEDKQMLLAIAAQMATLIENLKLVGQLAEEQSIKRELDLAAEVQQRMFPADGLEDVNLEVYGTCLPARGIGGDYYDYFVARDRHIGIAVADVAGKGIAAALLMSTVQAMLRCQLMSGVPRLTDLVSTISRLLKPSTGDAGYATFFFCEFDCKTRRLTYVNAGHNPPMVVRGAAVVTAGGRGSRTRQEIQRASEIATISEANVAVEVAQQEEPITLLTIGGPVIGNFIDGQYDQETIQLRRGDFLIAYSDGVTESWDPIGEEFGEERLRSIVVESLQLSARELTERIIESVRDWQGDAPQHDDVTLVVAKVK